MAAVEVVPVHDRRRCRGVGSRDWLRDYRNPDFLKGRGMNSKFFVQQVRERDATIEELVRENERLRALLNRYISAYPAFRIRPVGAPGSEKRIEQENLMALEDAAQAALDIRKEK